MPRLIMQIDETLENEGEDRMISGFAFQLKIEPLPHETNETETTLPMLVPYFVKAIKQILAANFGNPVVSHLAFIPTDGIDPLPTLDKLIDNYRAKKDSFPPELDGKD